MKKDPLTPVRIANVAETVRSAAGDGVVGDKPVSAAPTPGARAEDVARDPDRPPGNTARNEKGEKTA
jgi:hypothetical protein